MQREKAKNGGEREGKESPPNFITERERHVDGGDWTAARHTQDQRTTTQDTRIETTKPQRSAEQLTTTNGR